MSTPDTASLETLSPESLTIAIVDQSDDVREFAHDAADARLTQELNGEGGRFRRIVRSVWKGNIAREYYRQRYINEAQEAILESDNIYASEDVDDPARQRAKGATISRFVDDYESAIHESAGERRKDVSAAQAANEEGADVVTDTIKCLLRDYASGRLNDESLLEERTRALNDLRSTAGSEQLFGEGVMTTDNILEIAQNVRAAIDHGESMGRVMDQIRVVSGESRSGARTDAKYNRVDKIIDRINHSRVGSFINETTVATAVSVTASLARFGSTKLATTATMTLAPGIGSGVVAGLREGKRVKDERRQHAREMASGKDYDRGNAKRRDAMQETLYETVTAESLIEDLATTVDRDQLFAEDGVTVDETRMRDALASITAIQTRIAMSDSRSIDLISFSSVTEVETERLVLDIALATAKVTLREALDSADDDMARTLGFDIDSEFDENITRLSEAHQGIIEGDIDQKDTVFKALKRREIAKTTAKAALMGMGLGLVAQEIKAMVDPSTQGVVEQMWHAHNTAIAGQHHKTLLYGMFGSKHAATEVHKHLLSGDVTNHTVGNGTKLDVSSEYSLHNNGGHYELIGPAGKHINGINVDKSGALTPDSLHKLQQAGLTIHDKSTSVTNYTTQNRTVGVDKWLDHNKSDTTHVTRDMWYDNNTAKFDQNELRTWWGGANNSGVDAHGNFVFTVNPMTQNGSFHGANAVDWHQAAASGQLKMVFSATEGSQNHVFSVAIGPDGQAIIPKGSPLSQMFNMENGHAVFQGKYGEVVQSMGVDGGGVEHIRMLSTLVGQDKLSSLNIVDNIPHTTVNHAYEILGSNYNTTTGLGSFIEMAPVIPLYGRRSLEGLVAPGEPMPQVYGGGYESYSGQEQLDIWRHRRSPRLINNPEADLDVSEELDWYFASQGPDYVEELDRRIEGNETITNNGETTKLFVNIPVAAAHESGNIYNTLAKYASQDSTALNTTRFMLSLNWIEGSDEVEVQRTISEVERAIRNFPQLQISYFTETLPKSFVAEKKGAVYGSIIKSLYDMSARVVHHSKESDESSVDPVIVTNDADAKRISADYLSRIIKTVERSPSSEVLMGKIHWGSEVFAEYPGYGVVSAFFMLLEDMVRDQETHITPASWGPNSGFKTSAYAAVGGVNSKTGAGADSELGRMIFAARAVNPASIANAGYGGLLDLEEADVRDDTYAVTRGAWVDSSPERLLGCYKKGVPLTSAWNSFNNAGYAPRPDLADGQAEDIEKDFEAILLSVQNQFSGILSSSWGMVTDDSVVQAALETLFPQNGKKQWDIYNNHDGSKSFKFTVAGEKVLKETLTSLYDTVQEGLDSLDVVFKSRLA